MIIIELSSGTTSKISSLFPKSWDVRGFLIAADEYKVELSHVRNVNSANTKDAMGVRELHSTVLVLRRRLAQNNAILKQKEDEIHIIEQRVERIKRKKKKSAFFIRNRKFFD